MNISQVIMSAKGRNSSLNALLPAIKVETREDLKKYKEEGYFVNFTREELEEKLGEDNVKYIYYEKSNVYPRTIIWDKERYIYEQIVINHEGLMIFNARQEVTEKEFFESILEFKDKMYKNKEYSILINSFPDALRFEIFFDMYNDNYIEKDEIFNVFEDMYTSSDYGFDNIYIEKFKDIIKLRSEQYRKSLRKELSKLPNMVKVYRGEGEESTSYKDGAFSWSLSPKVATFFAIKNNSNQARIIEAEVNKKDILTYYNRRNEKEVWIFPSDIKNEKVIELMSPQEFQNLDFDISLYQDYRNILKIIPFNNKMDHDKLHSLRVLMFTLILGYEYNLDEKDLELLSIAAINHDRGRTHDNTCTKHGKLSYERIMKENYLSIFPVKNKIDLKELEFLMTYHCKDDKEGYAFIEKNFANDKERILKIFNIFKDSDALDRFRFGLKDLDIRYLRLEYSKKLLLIAKLAQKSLKL